MTAKTKKLGLLLFAAAALTTAIAMLTPSEPEYKHRRLSDWIRQWQVSQSSNDVQEAVQAVNAIGTNALPYLLRSIQYEPSTWQFITGKLPSTVRGTILRLIESITRLRLDRADTAVSGFFILGTNAAPAIPQLTALMADRSHPYTALAACKALGRGLGGPALPAMLAALANKSHPYRPQIVNLIYLCIAREAGTNACLPALLKALGDTDPSVRIAASNAVSWLTSTTLTNLSDVSISKPRF